jgi:hypothetical protein
MQAGVRQVIARCSGVVAIASRSELVRSQIVLIFN